LLPFNTSAQALIGSEAIYYLRPSGCSLVNTVRETKDNIPQFNGSILHRRFVQGLEMRLAVQLWKDNDEIACEDLCQEMLDLLMGYLYGLLNAVDNEGRISWTPEGYETRMLDNLRLLTYPVEERGPGAPLEIQFSLDTQYPYTIALTPRLSTVTDGGSTVITNTGNVPMYPVIKANSNAGTPLGTSCNFFSVDDGINTFDWYGSNPGSQVIPAGSYAEMDCFGNTIFMNGSGANLSPGIDFINSDFLVLLPGANTISITGTDCDVLWNPAWAG
jgi:hypothetical protein